MNRDHNQFWTLLECVPRQAEAGFQRYFALRPLQALGALTALTPGEFAVVHRKADILGCLDEPLELVAMLREECEAKHDRPRPIGFRS